MLRAMKRLTLQESGFTPREYRMLVRLSSPIKIQDFLDSLPMNWEKKGDTHMSPRRALRPPRSGSPASGL